VEPLEIFGLSSERLETRLYVGRSFNFF